MAQRKSFLVLGAGLMGSAVAFDLVRSSPKYSITVADANEETAATAVKSYKSKRVTAVQVDVQDTDEVIALMSEHAVTISAVPFHHNYHLTTAAIKAGSHFCDLGHSDTIVAQQLDEAVAAEKADICVIANCGLAPGLANILAMHAFKQMDSVESLQMRVGGLPQQPRPPFFYQLVFSVEG